MHRWPFYPGTGGPGEGNETTVNVPLSWPGGDAEYLKAMAEIVEPRISAFAPDLLLVSAGYDAAVDDPLGGMRVTADGFRELARRASGLCDRLALVLEGGYNVESLPGLVEATLEGIAEARWFGGRGGSAAVPGSSELPESSHRSRDPGTG